MIDYITSFFDAKPRLEKFLKEITRAFNHPRSTFRQSKMSLDKLYDEISQHFMISSFETDNIDKNTFKRKLKDTSFLSKISFVLQSKQNLTIYYKLIFRTLTFELKNFLESIDFIDNLVIDYFISYDKYSFDKFERDKTIYKQAQKRRKYEQETKDLTAEQLAFYNYQHGYYQGSLGDQRFFRRQG
jgi:hypothetical protein